jgi:hypothetical protein
MTARRRSRRYLPQRLGEPRERSLCFIAGLTRPQCGQRLTACLLAYHGRHAGWLTIVRGILGQPALVVAVDADDEQLAVEVLETAADVVRVRAEHDLPIIAGEVEAVDVRVAAFRGLCSVR